MRRGGTPRPGGTAGRLRFALGPALLTVALAAGCADSGPPQAGSGTAATGSASPSRTMTDAELCARVVGHWSREVLDGGTYGDYQSMGLSDRQYGILREVVDAARTVKRRQGPGAAEELIDRRAREECAERYRDGGPSKGPWS
ncbi:hypothetical protein GCM10010377_21070 [Streptomyces viridiviolaceus]|uniref:Lipoprotein n=1 Tax=Streptomyces viridiviolaceus TaxID=68282 RepID=A0ABW2E056_9ACTN|nr:hypothetical protein [Streptomyces viridiviolaceus]GHB30546.1 hypothetical protein GCM10010377_21070 [Streptomyces viridiviolaceus]